MCIRDREMTGSLDDETLRNFHERLLYLRNLEERKEAIKKNIEEQGKLTKELAKQIEEAKTLVAVEDLYRPYKQKKRTRAMIAKEKGLEPLANLILLQMTKEPLEKEAEAFINEEKDVKTVEAVAYTHLDHTSKIQWSFIKTNEERIRQKFLVKGDNIMKIYDLVIIGSGPAGMSAAIYAQRACLLYTSRCV